MFILCLPLIEGSNSDLPPGLLGTSRRIATIRFQLDFATHTVLFLHAKKYINAKV